MASASISRKAPLDRAKARYPHLTFVLGDAEDQATLERDRGAVRLHRDRRHHRHVGGHRRHAAADPSALHAVDPHRHRLLFPSLGAGAEDGGSARAAPQAAERQLHRHRRLSESDGPRRFRGDQPRAAATAAVATVRARHVRSTNTSRRCRASAICACAPIWSAGPCKLFPGAEILGEHPDSLPQRARQYRGCDPAHAALRQRAGDPVRRGQFVRRHFRGMRARPRRLQGPVGHHGAEAGRQGQGRRRAQGFCRGQARRADDPRRRPRPCRRRRCRNITR